MQLHSRRAFSGVLSDIDVKLQSLMWATESMLGLKRDHVFFASDAWDLLGAIIRPPAWPSFRFQSDKALNSLASFVNRRIEIEDSVSNRGAALIARSVTREDRSQSYVASSYPFWLRDLFESEARIASL